MEVFGTEFAYGGHPFPFTGVFEITPRDHDELGEQFQFRQSIQIGCTDFTYQEVRRIVEELGNQFRGDRYHLMNNNCNHFSSALTQVCITKFSIYCRHVKLITLKYRYRFKPLSLTVVIPKKPLGYIYP